MSRGADADIAALRRKQAEFKKTERAISRENAWMAIPALAPAAAVMALEGAAYIAGRLAPEMARRAPLVLERAEPYLRVGDNWATAQDGARMRRCESVSRRSQEGSPSLPYP